MDPLIWLLAAALIIGIAKGGLTAAGALAVPLVALVMNPIFAAAVLLPVFLITDLVALWLYRREFSKRNFAILAPGLLLGIVIAAIIVPYTSETLLLLITASVGLWTVWRRWARADVDTARPARAGVGLAWGTLAGITTFITHSGAPPVQAFLMPQNMSRLVFAGTMTVTMAFANYAKVPGYFAIGLFENLDWLLIVKLVGVGIAGTFLGRWLVQRMTDKVYMRVIEVLLLLLSILLLFRAGAQFFT